MAEFIFVPIVLSDTEAIAAKSACAAIATSMPGLYSPDHPLMTAALKIERAWREARADTKSSTSTVSASPPTEPSA